MGPITQDDVDQISDGVGRRLAQAKLGHEKRGGEGGHVKRAYYILGGIGIVLAIIAWFGLSPSQFLKREEAVAMERRIVVEIESKDRENNLHHTNLLQQIVTNQKQIEENQKELRTQREANTQLLEKIYRRVR